MVTGQATIFLDKRLSSMAGKFIGGNFQSSSIEGNDGYLDRRSPMVTGWQEEDMTPSKIKNYNLETIV